MNILDLPALFVVQAAKAAQRLENKVSIYLYDHN